MQEEQKKKVVVNRRTGETMQSVTPPLDLITMKRLGQYFTPKPLSDIMAKLSTRQKNVIRFLDPGAGIGILTASYVASLIFRETRPKFLHLIAIEQDFSLISSLAQTLESCRMLAAEVGITVTTQIIQEDFLTYAGSVDKPIADVVITNPPYRKIRSDSEERRLIRQIGLETTNTYTAFLYASMKCLSSDGELISITPRSFCNGSYHKAFRQAYLSTMALKHLIIMDSRDKVFADVLQETIIAYGIKSPKQSRVIDVSVYSSSQQHLSSHHSIPYSRVVYPDDSEQYIHIEIDSEDKHIAKRMGTLPTRLSDLHINVSTGPVVDFRAKEELRAIPIPGSAPLLYPSHFKKTGMLWPQPNLEKPNAIMITEKTSRSLVPNGWYVIVRRFSSREEKRRIVAYVYAGDLPGEVVGFENHINYFHHHGHVLEPSIAFGLAAYLNSQIVDDYYRLFGGHTQVNATDLRNIPYPSIEQIRAFGEWIMANPALDVDALLAKELFNAR